MFHLLTETSMFLTLPNGCLCQITGDAILHMRAPLLTPSQPAPKSVEPELSAGRKRRSTGVHASERPPKRHKRFNNETADPNVTQDVSEER